MLNTGERKEKHRLYPHGISRKTGKLGNQVISNVGKNEHEEMFLHKAKAEPRCPRMSWNILSDTWACDILYQMVAASHLSLCYEWRKNNHLQHISKDEMLPRHGSHTNKDRENEGLVANSFQESQGDSACSGNISSHWTTVRTGRA